MRSSGTGKREPRPEPPAGWGIGEEPPASPGKSRLHPDVARLEGSGLPENHPWSQAWPHGNQSQVPRVPQVPMSGAEPRGVMPWCQGSGCPLSVGTSVCPSHRPQCCQEEFWSSPASWKAGEAREHRLATEAVAHLGVIWALPSRPSAGLFLPSGITGQATWAGWLPRLNPFMWLPRSPMGMGPTGVTPDGVGWPLPFLVWQPSWGRKIPFPTDDKDMSTQAPLGSAGDWDRDGNRNGPVLLRVLPAGVGFVRDPKTPTMTQKGC